MTEQKTYEWQIVGFNDEIHKSGIVETKSLSSAKAKATKASGIFVRLWSVWYETRGHWARDNDILGRMTANDLRFLILKEV